MVLLFLLNTVCLCLLCYAESQTSVSRYIWYIYINAEKIKIFLRCHQSLSLHRALSSYKHWMCLPMISLLTAWFHISTVATLTTIKREVTAAFKIVNYQYYPSTFIPYIFSNCYPACIMRISHISSINIIVCHYYKTITKLLAYISISSASVLFQLQ